MESQIWMTGEPSLNELLSDPLTHLLLRHDKLTVFEVRREMRLASWRLKSARARRLDQSAMPLAAAG